MSRCKGLTLALCVFALPFLQGGCGGSSGSESPTPPPTEVITILTAQNVQCVQTVPFTLTLQAEGNSGSLSWSITSGQLPTGLSLDSNSGTIAGIPVSGTLEPVTIQAADSKAKASKSFYFYVYSKLALNAVSPPPAHLNAPYSLTITGQGASISNWSISSGQVPPGLSLHVSTFNVNVAFISGIPTQTGSYNFTVQVQDSTVPQTATMSVNLIVDDHLAIAKSSLKNGGQNQPYLDTFTAVNGTPPLQWSISSGNLPSGLVIDAASGQITGTPTNPGSFPYSVSVSDSSLTVQSDSAQGLLTIVQQLQIIGSLLPVYVGEPYNAGYTVFGGTPPYVWTVASGTLPPGMALQAGNIIGTPTQLGSYSFVLQVTDSGSPPYVITQPVTLNVVPTPLSILGNPISPAPVNVPYHSQIPISGGTAPYTWNSSSGQLPPGIFLDPANGFLDGTPTQIGTYNFVAGGTDSGSPPQTSATNVFMQIVARRGRNDSIATATPLGNSANISNPIPSSISPYFDPINAATPNPDTDFYKLVATGGSLVHVETYAQRSFGANPLDSVVEILDPSGQRYSSCTLPAYNSSCLNDDLDMTTLDSALDFKVPGSASHQTTFYVHVFDWRGDARPDMMYFLNIGGVVEPLTIAPTTLGLGATRGANYQQQFTPNGGTGNVTWTLGGGTLPPGWFLSSAGLLSGIATTDGSYTFTIKATDSASPPQISQIQFTLLIAEPVAITIPVVWPNACLDKPYSYAVLTTGGIPPIQFNFFSGRWVPINVNQTTGVVAGMAGVLGTFTGTVGAVDSAQPPSTTAQNVSLTVVNCP